MSDLCGLFDILTYAAISLPCFLQGAKLSRLSLLSGAGAWKLHGAVLTSTFLIFPLLGLGIGRLHLLDPTMAAGFLFLTLLPSTVQSSIAFTSIARGNIAAAVCSASFRSEEHTSELQSLMRISYAVFCLKKKKQHTKKTTQL